MPNTGVWGGIRQALGLSPVMGLAIWRVSKVQVLKTQSRKLPPRVLRKGLEQWFSYFIDQKGAVIQGCS